MVRGCQASIVAEALEYKVSIAYKKRYLLYHTFLDFIQSSMTSSSGHLRQLLGNNIEVSWAHKELFGIVGYTPSGRLKLSSNMAIKLRKVVLWLDSSSVYCGVTFWRSVSIIVKRADSSSRTTAISGFGCCI